MMHTHSVNTVFTSPCDALECCLPYSFYLLPNGASLVTRMVKNLPAVLETQEILSIPGLGRSPGERSGNLIPLFLPGESHGQRSLVG